MILEVKNLNVSYWSAGRYINALKSLSFALKEQEILGVVGESGSGKSTLAYSALKLLPLDAKTEGQIIFKEKKSGIVKLGRPQNETATRFLCHSITSASTRNFCPYQSLQQFSNLKDLHILETYSCLS